MALLNRPLAALRARAREPGPLKADRRARVSEKTIPWKSHRSSSTPAMCTGTPCANYFGGMLRKDERTHTVAYNGLTNRN